MSGVCKELASHQDTPLQGPGTQTRDRRRVLLPPWAPFPLPCSPALHPCLLSVPNACSWLSMLPPCPQCRGTDPLTSFSESLSRRNWALPRPKCLHGMWQPWGHPHSGPARTTAQWAPAGSPTVSLAPGGSGWGQHPFCCPAEPMRPSTVIKTSLKTTKTRESTR